MIRKILFWCHLFAGLTAGLVIFTMSITGALLAFEPQFQRASRRLGDPPAGAQALSPSAFLSSLATQRPGQKATGLTIYSDPGSVAVISAGRDAVFHADPYTGRILDNRPGGWAVFFRKVTDVHRWLATNNENRAIGRGITGACNIAFLFLSISGICLWFPRKWTRQNLEPITMFRPGLTGRARYFNWHNVTGFWSSLILATITVTGMVMSYPWANNLVYRIMGSEPPAARSNTPSSPAAAPVFSATQIDQMWLVARKQLPQWKSISMRLPQGSGMPVVFAIDDGYSWNPISRSQLSLDPATAGVVRWEPVASLSAGRKARSWIRTIHTGEAGRLPGQIVAFVASLCGAFLMITGFTLAVHRLRAWKKRRLQETTTLPGASQEAI